MGLNRKYTTQERQIARRIDYFQTMQRSVKKDYSIYLKYEMFINIATKKLNGKYKPKFS